jgi:hypothetical protein
MYNDVLLEIKRSYYKKFTNTREQRIKTIIMKYKKYNYELGSFKKNFSQQHKKYLLHLYITIIYFIKYSTFSFYK